MFDSNGFCQLLFSHFPNLMYTSVLYNLQNQMHINLIYQAVSDDCVLEK